MKNCFVYAFADEASDSLDGQIAALVRNHLNGIELRNVDGESVSGLSIAKAKEIRRRLDDHGLITWSAGSPIGKIGITDDFAPHLDQLRHTLDVANELGAKHLRMFSFFMPVNEDPAQYRDEVMERLARMAEAAEGSGVLLCHENEKGIYGDIASRCLDILTTFPQIKGIFDPANFIQSGQETLSAWEMLKPYIEYMHIKDSLPDGNVVPSGCGAGNVPQIVREFIAMGGRHFTIEPHLTVFSGLKLLEREGIESGIGQTHAYENSDAAFDAACKAFASILEED